MNFYFFRFDFVYRIPKSVQNIWALASSPTRQYFLYQSIPNNSGHSNLYIFDILNSSMLPIQMNADKSLSMLTPTNFCNVSEYSSWNSYSTFFSMIISSTIPNIHYQYGTVVEELRFNLCVVTDSKYLWLLEILISKTADLLTCQLASIGFVQLETFSLVKRLEFSKFDQALIQFENDLVEVYHLQEKKFNLESCIKGSVMKHCKFISSSFFCPQKSSLPHYEQSSSNVEISRGLIIVTVMIGGPSRLNNNTVSTGLLIWDWNKNQFRIFYNNFDNFETSNFDNSRLSNHTTIFQYYLQPCKSLLLLGIDKFGRLLSCNDLWHSNFAGAMYPVNYNLVEQVTSYHELEDEFDICTSQAKPDVSVDNQHHSVSLDLFTTYSESCSGRTNEITFEVEFHLENQLRTVPQKNYFISFQSNPNLSSLQAIESNLVDDEIATVVATSEVDESSSSISRRRNLFAVSIQSIIPTPRGIASGDYLDKQLRLKQLSDGISRSNSDLSYRSERSKHLIEEAEEMIKRQVEQNHLKSLKRVEKQKMRALLREQALIQLLEIAVNTPSTQQLPQKHTSYLTQSNGNIKINDIPSKEIVNNSSVIVNSDEIRVFVEVVLGDICKTIVNSAHK